MNNDVNRSTYEGVCPVCRKDQIVTLSAEGWCDYAVHECSNCDTVLDVAGTGDSGFVDLEQILVKRVMVSRLRRNDRVLCIDINPAPSLLGLKPFRVARVSRKEEDVTLVWLEHKGTTTGCARFDLNCFAWIKYNPSLITDSQS
jgi:hypothetical protein